MRYSKMRQKRFIIIGLCSIVFLMCVGYAAFSTVLTINSTSEITSAWDVEITGVRGVNDASLTYNDAYDKVDPSISNDKLSVTIQTGLLYPGDTRIYEIEVTNKGNVDAEVSTKFENVINDSTIFSFDGVSPVGSDGEDILTPGGTYNPSLLETVEPFDLPAFTNNKRYLYLMIKFRDNVTSQPKDLNPSVTLTLNAVQKSENTPTVPVGEETVTIGGVEVPVVNSGDGLYEDWIEEGRYVYRGGNPNNYIEFSGMLWRIISIEDDKRMKVILNDSDMYLPYDENLSGIWADSSLQNYLNNSFYNSLSEKNYIVSSDYNVGFLQNPGVDRSLLDVVTQEKSVKWNGFIGLLNFSDYMKSSTNSECVTYINARPIIPYPVCHNSNYLQFTYSGTMYWWLLNSPNIQATNRGVYLILYNNTTEGVSYGSARLVNLIYPNVKPVLYLSSELTLTGDGDIEHPYTILNN